MALPNSDRDHPQSAVTILLRRLRCRRTGHLLSQEDNSMLHVNRTSACLVFALFLTSFSLSARADTVGGQQAATVTAAEALGRSGDVGAIAIGRYGDLIAVAGDPLNDVKTLETVKFVMKGGGVVKNDYAK
jgi:hypothetical protein